MWPLRTQARPRSAAEACRDRRRTDRLEIETGAEPATGTGQDHDATGVVGMHRVERSVQIVDQLERHRVEPFGSVERDDPDVVVRSLDADRFDRDLLVGRVR